MDATRQHNSMQFLDLYSTSQIQYYRQATKGRQRYGQPNDACKTTAPRHQGSMISSARPYLLSTPLSMQSSTDCISCFKCGKWVNHSFQDHNSICPARSAKCHRCGNFGHFSRVCFNKRTFGTKSEKITQYSNQISKSKSAYRKARDAKRLEEFLTRKNLTNALPFSELSDNDFIKTNKRSQSQFLTPIPYAKTNTQTEMHTAVNEFTQHNIQLNDEISELQNQIKKLNADLIEEKSNTIFYKDLLNQCQTDKVETHLKHQDEISDLKNENSNSQLKISQLQKQISDLLEQNKTWEARVYELQTDILEIKETYQNPSYHHIQQTQLSQTSQYQQQQYYQPQQPYIPQQSYIPQQPYTQQNRQHRRDGRQNFGY